MKVLILSCGTGQGHNSAARAVEEALKRRGIECQIADPLSFGRRKTAGVVAAAYNGVIKDAPKAFGVIYKVGDLYSSTRLTSPVYFANTLYAGHLESYILENHFTVVICTHLFAMEAVTALWKRPEFTVPCYGVLTDYTCIPFFAETKLDGYFIPQEDLRAEMVEKGISEQRLYSTGIPVSGRFAHHTAPAAARTALDLPADQPIILVMSGGVGCGNLLELCRELLQYTTKPFTACVMTGRNRKLKGQLDEHFQGDPRLRTIAFTEKVDQYMNAADVMISKPGGLTSTEAAVANIPLVHLLAFSGCETKNAAFFSARGLSLQAGSVRAAVESAWRLINHPELAERMRSLQRTYIAPDAADRIVSKVIGS